MAECEKCGKTLLSEWYFCPNCGKRSRLTAEETLEELRPPNPKTYPNPGGGSYGLGVRAQVFEVIVRQGIAGAPWRQICAGPMQVNNIPPEDVQAEIDRRVELLRKGKIPKPHPKKPGDGKDDDDTDKRGGQAAPVPKKPLKPSDETGNAIDLPPPPDDLEYEELSP